MIRVRRGEDRGYADHGWLASFHTFSFADYHDPQEMGFGPLRVLNEDLVQPGKGFPSHSHRDMEIVTYVLEGALEHKDSLGTGSVIRPGDVQRMRAGTGITHSEYNASDAEAVHFLQIWIIPDRQGLAPGYEQKHFDRNEMRGRLRLIAAPDGAEEAVSVHQDVRLYAALLGRGDALSHPLAPGRRAYLHLARGAVSVNDEPLKTGDGLKVWDEPLLRVSAYGEGEGELLLFDLGD